MREGLINQTEYFKDLIDDKSEMPENFEEFFISNIKDIMVETFKHKQDKEFLSFIDGFLTEYGQKILEFNLKNFTKEEIWKNILLCKTPEYKKLINFQVEYNKFLMNLLEKYTEDQEEKELEKTEKAFQKLDEENKDAWTTE